MTRGGKNDEPDNNMQTPLRMFTFALLISLIFSTGMRGHTREGQLTFHFRLKEASLDTTYLDNGRNLAILRKHLAAADFIDSISVTVSSSPEGSYSYNARLAAARADETKKFLQQISAGSLTEDRIGMTVIEEDWQGLTALIQDNYEGKDKDKIIGIINAEGISDATREWRLNRLDEGRTWKLLKTRYCRQLRYATVMRIYWKVPGVQEPKRDSMIALHHSDIHSTSYSPTPPHSHTDSPEQQGSCLAGVTAGGKSSAPRTPDINLRTNLLYDAALVPNIGAEVHFGKGWALNASYNHAWWDISDRHYFWRIYGGELGVRKYLSSGEKASPMTGHHIGLYGQAYTYDFETGGKGQMSRLTYGGGLEYGYTLPVGKRISIDFSIGAGYLTGEYETYIPDLDCYVWQTTAQRHWFGPTKAEITLVWAICRNAGRKKGGRP